MGDFLKGWLKSDAARRDSIDVKRIYIDICGGNLIDAVIFSQIMYWHEPKADGKPRLEIKREGHLWLAKRYEDWWEDCRVPERPARDSIARLIAIGLLVKKLWHFDGRPTVHLRVNGSRFKELVAAVENGTIDALRARLLSDASRQIVIDATRQIEKAPNRRQPSNGIDATRQIAPPAIRRHAADAYTETTVDDDGNPDSLQPDQHHQAAAPTERELDLLRSHFLKLALPESLWRNWLAHPVEHLLACILHAQAEGANPPGLLRSMLDSGGLPLPKYVAHARRLLDQVSEPATESDPPHSRQAKARAPRVARDEPSLDFRPGEGNLTMRDVWRSVTGQLSMQLNQHTFATYLRGAEPVRYADGELIVQPRTPYASQWFERAAPMLDALASQIAGTPVRVRCEVEPSPVAVEGETA